MTLQQAVEKYLGIAGRFGETMALSQFGLPRAELEALFSAWDEDYHVHRHFELVPASWVSESSPAYCINGALYSGIILRDSIREALD
jgi:hypothetical protein